jgi:2-hydroxy-4-carboxymuconate semialdehyde hemiacetal dehydrogenase
MNLVVAGEGAFGVKHLEGVRRIPGAQVRWLVGGAAQATQEVAGQFGVRRWSLDLQEALEDPDVEAVILATPTPLHVRQAMQCLEHDKHVQVEIPLADNLADAELLAAAAARSGRVAMAGHTRRFNPSHQWIRRRVAAGELSIQQMDVQTYFMRRQNLNALGRPRSWTDHLLWHHAAHTVDLFAYQTGEPIVVARGLQGPQHPQLGIAMDMSIQLKSASGAICTLSLSFNNDGPLGSVFRYICDKGTYIARYDDLTDGYGDPIGVAAVGVAIDGVELQDREFIAAIREGRAPNGAIDQVLPAYRILHEIKCNLS